MNALETARFLGYNNIVWIDDHFNTSPEEVANLIISNYEVCSQYNFNDTSINEILNQYSAFKDLDTVDVFYESIKSDLISFLQTKAPVDLLRIKNIVLEQETASKSEHQKELSPKIIEQICNYLQIDKDKRLNFSNAYSFISSTKNDNDTLYMIDLSEGESNPEKGLDILIQLIRQKSKSTAFILTHNTSKQDERKTEILYSDRPEFKNKITFSVISKEKLYNESLLDNSLKAALKKVTLRKNMVAILKKLEGHLQSVYSNTNNLLLDLTPEDIEKYIYEKGESEGVSELYVIERAFLSNTKYYIKDFFNLSKHQPTLEKLRQLKHIPIEIHEDFKIHPNLEYFRKLEIFNDSKVINNNFTAISCGDIFEIEINNKKEKFILLAQPCDIALRGLDGNRALKEGILAPLRVKNIKYDNPNINLIEIPKFIQQSPEYPIDLYSSYHTTYQQLKRSQKELSRTFKSLNKALKKNYDLENKYIGLKEMKLDFKIDDIQYYVNFTNAINVNLSILDLVAFNKEGYLSFENNQTISNHLTIAMQKRFEIIKDLFNKHFIELKTKKGSNRNFYLQANKALQIALFLEITPEFKCRKNKLSISWPVSRIGNIAEPYASEILKKYMYIMSRTAYDLDYTLAI